MMRKRLLVIALALFAITSINALRANAQGCNNVEAFGVRQARPVDGTRQSQVEVTYFSTDDPNVFLSERAGLNRSASFMSMGTNQFFAKVGQLERQGVASITKRQSATSYLGEMAELNLERAPQQGNARMVNASQTSGNIYGLNRQTEVNVYKGSSVDGDYYRVRVISWFVNSTTGSAQKVVDYDASVLMKPGQTAVFKLTSDYELSRSGSSRNYMAVTLLSVNNVGLASLR